MEKGQGNGMDTLQTDKVFTHKEYIEREEAVMKIREWFWSAPGVHPKLDRDAAEDILFAIPAADVVAVRHGRWKWYDSFSYRCSACKKYWIAPGDQYDYHYCPNCGARMDGDGE